MHIPVLLDEILGFIPASAKTMFDLTFGAGGHSLATLKKFNSIRIFACDRDIDTINQFENIFQDKLSLYHMNSQRFINEMAEQKIKADFILADLGVSSMQINQADRGFSFQQDGPLDMRMDRTEPLTANKILNTYSAYELKMIFYRYGEESYASKIASTIVKQREKTPLNSTGELVKLIENVKPQSRFYKLHPATKVFMALRIEVNKELECIQNTLNLIDNSLNSGGRAAFISFHSLEDRIVKNTFRDLSRTCICPPQSPICTCGSIKKFNTLTKKPLVANTEEVNANPRSRSAKMRVIEKI